MDRRYFPVADDRLGHRMHPAQQLPALADGKLVHVTDPEIMRRIRGGHGLLRPQVVLVLSGLRSTALIARVGEDLGKSVGSDHVQPVVKAVLETRLKGVEGHMTVVQASGSAVDLVVLRIRAQRLLQLAGQRI